MMETKNEDFPDHSGEGEWLTYSQISQLRGIGSESAVKLAQRQRWRRDPGNDGTARVLVPPEWLNADRRHRRRSSGEHIPDPVAEWSRAIAAFEAAATASRDRAEVAEARANRAEAENDRLIADLRAERERSAAELAREWEERDRMQAAVDRAEQGRKAAEARATAATIRADHDHEALARQRERADEWRHRTEGLLSQLAVSEAEVKAAHDRAWASGEAAGLARDQLATTERRFEGERKRAERAEKLADNDREALLNSESKTWRTLAALEAADKRTKQAQSRLAETEAAAQTAIRSVNMVRHENEARRAQGVLRRLLAAWRGL
jgi:hypothetical protein